MYYLTIILNEIDRIIYNTIIDINYLNTWGGGA